jgi:hypothetical protein
MVSPLLRELAGPFRPNIPFEYAQELSDAWERVCRRATHSGSAEELHAARDDYQALLLAHLKILVGWLTFLSRLSREYPSGFSHDFTAIRDQLQQHYDSLFPRWQTLDDLEALLLERTSLPNDQLKPLAAIYPAPQAWYDEPDAPATHETVCSRPNTPADQPPPETEP